MSFTTRCPACGTVFRVVADQLKISDGWVRCGHCSDVFDATIHLQAWSPPAPPAAPSGPPVVSPPATAEPVSASAPWPMPTQTPMPSPAAPVAPGPSVEPDLPIDVAPEPVALAEAGAGPDAAAPPSPSAGALPPRPVEAPVEETISDDDLRAWFGDGPLDAPGAAVVPAAEPGPPAPAGQPTPLTPVDAAPAPDEGPSSDFQAELQRFAQSTRGALEVLPTLPATARPDVATDAGLATPPAASPLKDAVTEAGDEAPTVPGFVRQAQRRAFWTSPGVRIGLGLVALLLAGLLAGQWAVQHRHQLAAAHPPLRPLIEQACGWLGCDLQALRRIDDVEIESAELVRRLGNFYSFDFVLRNRSALEVALPALELTLTNIGDQAVARRVFLPQDWPDAPTALAPNGRVSVSLRLSLMLGDDAPTAGYRALVFYP